MPTIDLGKVKGDTGVSMRSRGAWTASTSYVNNTQYIDVVTNGGSSYSCKTTHTSGTTFSNENWNLIAQKGDKGDKGNKGDNGITPIIKAGTATSLDATATPTVSATTSGNTTTLNFGIPKGDTSDIKTPTFTDTVSTYSTLSAANTAAETASNAIKSKVSIFTILSNMKKSFSAIVQGLKILGTNVGAINGITDSLTSTSSNIAASSTAIKTLNDKITQLNGNLAIESGRSILVNATCIGGTTQTYTISGDSIANYRNLLFILTTGTQILASNVLDKNFFVSGYGQRVFWYDLSYLYYIDVGYISNTQVQIRATYPSTAALGLFIVGFN